MSGSTKSVPASVTQFLTDHPDIETIEVLLPDVNGVMRGKWLPRENLLKVFKGGFKMPLTTANLDIWGRDIPELVFESGDADGICVPIERSLQRVPWSKRPAAQVQVSLSQVDGTPYEADSRVVLQQVFERYRAMGLRPVVALELEFYLFKAERSANGEPVHTGDAALDVVATEAYSVDTMQDYEDVFYDMRQAADALGLPVDTFVKEASPSQYEINLHHVDDPVLAADQALMLKRMIKKVARNHGFCASFMAKPFGDLPGNGLHVHFSLLNEAGENVYDNGTELGSDLLRHAIAGLADSMAESMAVFAPNQNSYRRFQAGCHAPLSPSWGYENRTVALRVPAGDTRAMRVEHRVAGADANPYLTLAAILAGAYRGITEKREAPPPTEGNAYDQHKPTLPVFWSEALKAFDQSTFVGEYLNPVIQRIYSASKWQELNEFRRVVTRMEYDAYLGAI